MNQGVAQFAVEALLKELGKRGFYGPEYQINLSADLFVHFTTKERAEQIIKDGRILMDSPYQASTVHSLAGM